MNFDRASNGVHSAGELHQRAVAHQLDDTAGMGGNRRIDQFTPQGVQPGEGPGLVDAHEAGISDDIGRQDRRKPPLEAFFRHVDRSPRPTTASL